MWQTLILYKWKKVFGWLPVETLIKNRQNQYYEVLKLCNKAADSGLFIELLLEAIRDSLSEIEDTEQATEQVKRLLEVIGTEPISCNDLMRLLDLKHRPTFRKFIYVQQWMLGLSK